MSHTVSFVSGQHQPVELPAGEPLSHGLTVENSPILFGCRTGLCGTCVSVVHEGLLPPPSEDELEVLDIVAPNEPRARLACQIDLQADIRIGELP